LFLKKVKFGLNSDYKYFTSYNLLPKIQTFILIWSNLKLKIITNEKFFFLKFQLYFDLQVFNEKGGFFSVISVCSIVEGNKSARKFLTWTFSIIEMKTKTRTSYFMQTKNFNFNFNLLWHTSSRIHYARAAYFTSL
jgi:hypothetical protein